jgi:hypothetical protein
MRALREGSLGCMLAWNLSFPPSDDMEKKCYNFSVLKKCMS